MAPCGLSMSDIGRLRPGIEDTCCGCSWCWTDRPSSPECTPIAEQAWQEINRFSRPLVSVEITQLVIAVRIHIDMQIEHHLNEPLNNRDDGFLSVRQFGCSQHVFNVCRVPTCQKKSSQCLRIFRKSRQFGLCSSKNLTHFEFTRWSNHRPANGLPILELLLVIGHLRMASPAIWSMPYFQAASKELAEMRMPFE